MQKSILTLIILLIFVTISSAKADTCQETHSKVDNSRLYAEIISRSHLELELVVVRKTELYYRHLFQVKGGVGFTPANVPSCDAQQDVTVNWLNDAIGTLATFEYDGQTTTYRICQYNVRNKLVAEYKICNFATGD